MANNASARTIQALIASLIVFSAFVGCSPGRKQLGPAQRSVPVTVETVSSRDFPIQLAAIGHAESYQTVAVKPQVAGQLISVLFTPGQDVAKGQLLFEIDSRAYDAALGKSEAVLAKDQALAAQADNDESKAKDLVGKGLAAQEQLDTAYATAAALRSQVKADEAQVENDSLELAFCKIAAPISGRTGVLQVDAGNIVAANQTVLVTINQLSPIYVTFSLPEQSLPDIKKYSTTGSLRILASAAGDERGPLSGDLAFMDNAVDSSTGTFLLKGKFANLDGRLWPGQFANLVVVLGSQPDAIVVPSQALQSGQAGQFVFVVKADKTVEMRPVTVSRTIGAEAAIAQGLKPGETVVTDGQLLLVPGAAVDVRNATKVSGQPPKGPRADPPGG